MSKVPAVVKQAEQTAITVFDNPLVQVTPDAGLDLFPQLKLVHPIEVKPGAPFKPAGPNEIGDGCTLGFFDGKVFKRLEAPYTLCVLAGRNAARKLIYPNGWTKTEYDAAVDAAKKSKSAPPISPKFHRAYALLGERGKSHDAYIDLCKQEGAEVGSTMIVIVFTSEGAGLAEFPLFKTSGSYWRNKLLQSSWKTRVGLRVLITSHYDNQTVGRSQNAYWDAKKFTQCETIALTTEQIAEVPGLAKKFSAPYEAWLDGVEVIPNFDGDSA